MNQMQCFLLFTYNSCCCSLHEQWAFIRFPTFKKNPFCSLGISDQNLQSTIVLPLFFRCLLISFLPRYLIRKNNTWMQFGESCASCLGKTQIHRALRTGAYCFSELGTLGRLLLLHRCPTRDRDILCPEPVPARGKAAWPATAWEAAP